MKNKMISVLCFAAIVFLLCSCTVSDSKNVSNSTVIYTAKSEKITTEISEKITSDFSEKSTAETSYKTTEKTTVSTTKKFIKNDEENKKFSSEKVDENLSVFSKENADVKLTVSLPKNIRTGEKFILTATVTNKTDKSISYTCPSQTPNMHNEIKVKISDGKREFIDLDIQNKASDCAIWKKSLDPQTSFTEAINFQPAFYSYNSSSDSYEPENFEAGKFNGTAVFNYYDGETPVNISLDFTVNIV